MVIRAGLLAVSLMIFGWALPGAAQPYLLKDVAPETVDPQRPPSSLSGLTSVGSRAVFVVGRGDEDESASELWTTDGTDAGTERLRTFLDLSAQVVGSDGRIAFVLVFQPSSYPKRPATLWRTDGTPEGTFALTRTVLTSFGNAVIHQGSLVFSACTEETDCEPWASDGTPGGTRRLRDITPGPYGSDPRGPFLSLGDRVYFFATAPDGPGLWGTDLTRQGTRRVALLPLYSNPQDLQAAGERLFFVGKPQGSLWTSDGTAGGTRPVPPFDGSSGRTPKASRLLGAVGGIEYFSGVDPALGPQVYRTDGTPGGTRRLTSFPRSRQEPEVTEAIPLADRLLFVGSDLKLWTSGGSRASTHPLTGCAGGCPAPFLSYQGFSRTTDGRLAFFVGAVGNDVEPWVTDGTAAGTRRLLELCANGYCGSYVTFGPVIRGRVLFAAGGDLWSTDGTPTGTWRVGEGAYAPDQAPLPVAAAGSHLVFAGFDKSADPGTFVPQLKSSTGRLRSERILDLPLRDGLGSSPTVFTALGDDVLFFACGSPPYGVWKTRGTPETTVQVTDVQAACFPRTNARPLVVLGGVAYFAAIRNGDYWTELWRTDGTPEGTWQVSHVGPDKYVTTLNVFRGKVLFAAEQIAGDATERRTTLWSTDGTAAGTAPLFDLPAIFVYDLAVFEDALYFQGESRDNNLSNQIFRSDGTAAGTHALFPGGGDMPPHFLRFGGQTFIASAGDLWRTDGTPEGTRPITQPGGPIQTVLDLAPLGDHFYFMGLSFTDPNEYEGTPTLYRTDGTVAATVPVKSFALDPTFETPYPYFPQPEFTPLGGSLFFVAWEPEHGGELWKTDGTAAGTALVADVNPGPGSARISGLTAVNGRLFFAADDGEHGIELWTSDGTAAGTRRLSDIAPGPLSSSPRDLAAIGGRLYFSADDQTIGREPWVLPLDGAFTGKGKQP
jgi:ELWxxDGT repeat protein